MKRILRRRTRDPDAQNTFPYPFKKGMVSGTHRQLQQDPQTEGRASTKLCVDFQICPLRWFLLLEPTSSGKRDKLFSEAKRFT